MTSPDKGLGKPQEAQEAKAPVEADKPKTYEETGKARFERITTGVGERITNFKQTAGGFLRGIRDKVVGFGSSVKKGAKSMFFKALAADEMVKDMGTAVKGKAIEAKDAVVGGVAFGAEKVGDAGVYVSERMQAAYGAAEAGYNALNARAEAALNKLVVALQEAQRRRMERMVAAQREAKKERIAQLYLRLAELRAELENEERSEATNGAMASL